MIKKSMGIRSKLLLTFLSIIVFTAVCTTYFSVRATVYPLRAIINRNVKSMVDEFYVFLEANPDIDQALIKTMCNEQITVGKTGFIFVFDTDFGIYGADFGHGGHGIGPQKAAYRA